MGLDKTNGMDAVPLGAIARLGDDYLFRLTPVERRKSGATYTPEHIIREMLEMVSGCAPDTIVDCGCGSGRLSIAAAMSFPRARVVAVDVSGAACSMCEAAADAYGVADRVAVHRQDFMDFSLTRRRGERVLWIANPPYVRHHDIDAHTKERFKEIAARLGLEASGLSGLHVCFLAKVAELWRPGDRGVFVTSAEWLDTSYGSFLRRLLTERLGLERIHVHPKGERAFDGVDATAAVFSFGEGGGSVTVRAGDREEVVDAKTLARSQKWSRTLAAGHGGGGHGGAGDLVPLGEIAAVHRGVVTGNNRFWVREPSRLDGIPGSLSVPVVSHAREITGECAAQNDPASLNRLITIPADIGRLDGDDRAAAERIIASARGLGVDRGYVASRRTPWWAIRTPEPPALMMTYMARRPPTFVVNRRRLTMLNVVHGIYPRFPLSERAVERLAEYLNRSVSVADGRTYCGGLTKFEPREAEALLVPSVEELES